jgi:hypothetical protein
MKNHISIRSIMATLTTVLVGLGPNANLIFGAQGSNAGLIQVINLDTENTVYVGNASNIMIGQSGVFPLTPGSSMSFSGSIALYAVTAHGVTVEVGIVPGGGNYSSGTVNIDGPVTIEASGPIDVIGEGGYISPGQIANIYTLPGSGVQAVAGATTALGTWNVSTYSSIIFGQSQTANNSVAAGAAVCSVWQLTWMDSLGNVVASDVVSSIINGIGVWEIPVRGSQLTVSLYNPGTVGTVNNLNVGAVYVDGSYRVIPNIRAYNNISAIGFASVINGCTIVSQPFPQGGVNSWVANIQESFPAAAVTYAALLGLWAGEVTGSLWITPTNLAAVPTIVDLTYAVQGGVIAGNGYAYGLIFEASSASGANPSQITLNLPPTQCAVIFETPAVAGHFIMSLIGVPN